MTLKLANQREAAVPEAPVLVQRESWIDLAGAMARLQETVEEARETIGRMLNRS